LGTEVGLWYYARRAAQNTADASAVAGALAANAAIVTGADPVAAAQTAGLALATTNGFQNGTTTSLGTLSSTINYPPSAGAFTTTVGAVEAVISAQMTPLISGLFGGGAVTVGAHAVAVVEAIGNACALALSGDLSVQGNITSYSCALASNASDSTAVNVTGSLAAMTASAVGGCCGAGNVFLLTPSSQYHPPTSNPFLAADAIAFPSFTGTAGAGSCASPPSADSNGNVNLWQTIYDATQQAYCNSDGSYLEIDVQPGQTLWFRPGTYIFYNTSLVISGGTIQCQYCSGDGQSGLTLVFLGTGTLSIGPAASFGGDFNAPTNNPAFPALSGLLFYGRGSSPASLAFAASSVPPDGAIYFPNATLTATEGINSNCLPMVAQSLTLYGTFSLSPSGCIATFNISLPQLQGVRLVQ
jgi:hypothetical protein